MSQTTSYDLNTGKGDERKSTQSLNRKKFQPFELKPSLFYIDHNSNRKLLYCFIKVIVIALALLLIFRMCTELTFLKQLIKMAETNYDLQYKFSKTLNNAEFIEIRDHENIFPKTHSPDGQVSENVCIYVPNELKFDCYPERDGNQTECEARGCCWISLDDTCQESFVYETVDKYTGTISKSELPYSGIPFCFYPLVYPTYKMTDIFPKDWGYLVYMQRDVHSYYPNDIMELAMDVKLETRTRLHFKVILLVLCCI